jgi:hypothetical protein
MVNLTQLAQAPNLCVSAWLSATALLCLQVERSLVQHLNSSLKDAVDKADDAEAEAMQVKQQVRKGHACVRVPVCARWSGFGTRIVAHA